MRITSQLKTATVTAVYGRIVLCIYHLVATRAAGVDNPVLSPLSMHPKPYDQYTVLVERESQSLAISLYPHPHATPSPSPQRPANCLRVIQCLPIMVASVLSSPHRCPSYALGWMPRFLKRYCRHTQTSRLSISCRRNHRLHPYSSRTRHRPGVSRFWRCR